MDEKINSPKTKVLDCRPEMRFWLSARIGSSSIVLMLCFLLGGCTTSTPDAYWFPTSDPAWSTSEGQINRAEKFWNRRGISSYRIKVRVWGFWIRHEHALVVREGKVVEFSSTCVPDRSSEPCCTDCFDPEGFTVPGLFVAARDRAYASKITFDPDYGFPSTISYNNTAIADEEEEWTVLEFQPENQ